MYIETQRLIITEFNLDVVNAVHTGSLDDDNRRFVPDEVFETADAAERVLKHLIECYTSGGPLAYSVLKKDRTYIGYVQAVPLESGEWEIGYHINNPYTRRGYATEAVRAFLPVIMRRLAIDHIYGICDGDNIASAKVLERCGFVCIGSRQSERGLLRKYIYRSGI